MSLNLQIKDGTGTLEKAKVSEESLHVISLPYPPLKQQKIKPFRQYLTVNGLDTGSSDMRVVGALTAPIEFFVKSHPDHDRYITSISFIIADAGALLNEFGAITALTNGCTLHYESVFGSVVLHEALKSNFDFLRLCLFNPPFGSGSDAFRAQNIVGLSEAYVPILDTTKYLPPFGIKLDKGTTQRLVFSVRDTTTALDGFNCIAYGFDRFL